MIRKSDLIWMSIYAVIGIAFVVGGIYTTIKDDESERLRSEGCQKAKGRLVSNGFRNVSIFREEHLIDEYRRQFVNAAVGGLIPEADQNAFRKQLGLGRIYFAVPTNTPVRLLERSTQGNPKVEVMIIEGPHKGKSGWIEPFQYGCDDWNSRQDSTFESMEAMLEGSVTGLRSSTSDKR
jgi:hypothetical protein